MLQIRDESNFYNPRFIITNFKKKTPIKKVEVYDKLFYSIYHKLNEEDLVFNKYNELLEKIRVIDEIQSKQLKCKNIILDNLTSPNICLYCLPILCQIWKINIIWFTELCYYECVGLEEGPLFYLSYDYTWSDTINVLNKYKIEDIYKPLKSIGYYKLDQLKAMSVGLPIEGKLKKDYYDGLLKYYNHIKLI